MAYEYINAEIKKITKRYMTRDPFELLKRSGAIIKYSDKYNHLKGYYFHSQRSHFVVLNAKMPREEKRIVAAHEFGHFTLHKELAKYGPIRDSAMFVVKSKHEYEANLFSAELLLSDGDVSDARKNTGGDFFNMSRSLSVMPELLLFKLHSMNGRGYKFNLPLSLDSAFLKNY
ncbi:MAG: ImmA/IrrE family metallo-endopeptidase [Eubacteriales bacterium]|nr:ImmA/IrrE family metallo-endopeptidase [Eubacteriales bacterium]